MRARVIAVLTAVLAAPAPFARAAPPSPPAIVHAWAQVRETPPAAADLFVDTLVVYWRPVRGEGVLRYRVLWSQSEDFSGSTPRFVNQDEAANWIETSFSVSFAQILDWQRVFVKVEAHTASESSPAVLVSTTADERPAKRGDVNEDGARDIGDPIALLFHLFLGADKAYKLSTQSRAYSSDPNGDARVDVSDAVFILQWLFLGGSEPVEVAPGAGLTRILLGVFDGEARDPIKGLTRLKCIETWQGKKHAVVNVFVSFVPSDVRDLFNPQRPSSVHSIWANGNVPMISWQPCPASLFCDGTPANIEVLVTERRYDDSAVRPFARELKRWLSGPDGKYGAAGSAEIRDDRRAYIRFAHEMNGVWTPWNAANGDNRPEEYVAMWRHVHEIVMTENGGLDSSHVQWVWCPNNADSEGPLNRMELYYPGGDVVDWVGIDGYNWGLSQPWSNQWSLPSDVFDGNFPGGRMLTRLRTLAPAKPVCIPEYGTSSVTARTPAVVNDVDAKARWMTAAFNYFLTHDIRMASWFNIDKVEEGVLMDRAFFGDLRGQGTFSHAGRTFRCYDSYRNAVRSKRVVGLGLDPSPAAENPRLLTDDEFAGR